MHSTPNRVKKRVQWISSRPYRRDGFFRKIDDLFVASRMRILFVGSSLLSSYLDLQRLPTIYSFQPEPTNQTCQNRRSADLCEKFATPSFFSSPTTSFLLSSTSTTGPRWAYSDAHPSLVNPKALVKFLHCRHLLQQAPL